MCCHINLLTVILAFWPATATVDAVGAVTARPTWHDVCELGSLMAMAFAYKHLPPHHDFMASEYESAVV